MDTTLVVEPLGIVECLPATRSLRSRFQKVSQIVRAIDRDVDPGCFPVAAVPGIIREHRKKSALPAVLVASLISTTAQEGIRRCCPVASAIPGSRYACNTVS